MEWAWIGRRVDQLDAQGADEFLEFFLTGGDGIDGQCWLPAAVGAQQKKMRLCLADGEGHKYGAPGQDLRSLFGVQRRGEGAGGALLDVGPQGVHLDPGLCVDGLRLL